MIVQASGAINGIESWLKKNRSRGSTHLRLVDFRR